MAVRTRVRGVAGLQSGAPGFKDPSLPSSPPSSPGTEPLYDPTFHTLVFPLPAVSTQYPTGFPPGNAVAGKLLEDFSSYANTTAMVAAYATSQSHGSLNLDTTTGVSAGTSCRVDWSSDGDLGASDANVSLQKRLGKVSDGIHKDFTNYSATARHQIVTCQMKFAKGTVAGGFTSGYLFNSGYARGDNQKIIVPYRDPNATFNKATLCTPKGGGHGQPVAGDAALNGQLLWEYSWDSANQEGHTPAGGAPLWTQSGNPAGVVMGPSVAPANLGDNTWRRVTIELIKESGDLTGDGVVRLWVGGIQCMNHDGTDAANPAYNIGYTGDGNGWCDPIWFFGIYNAGVSQQQSCWVTDIQQYYVTGS